MAGAGAEGGRRGERRRSKRLRDTLPQDSEKRILEQAPRGWSGGETPDLSGDLAPKRTLALLPERSPVVASPRESPCRSKQERWQDPGSPWSP